jgi:hypothetical protein
MHILLALNHIETFCNSLFIRFAFKIWFSVVRAAERVLSSAKSINLKNEVDSTISLMNIRNKRGPKTDPCGTPC